MATLPRIFVVDYRTKEVVSRIKKVMSGNQDNFKFVVPNLSVSSFLVVYSVYSGTPYSGTPYSGNVEWKGFVHCCCNNNTLQMSTIYVDADYRLEGIGSSMVKWIMDETMLAKKDATRITKIEAVPIDGSGSEELLEKLGFRKVENKMEIIL